MTIKKADTNKEIVIKSEIYAQDLDEKNGRPEHSFDLVFSINKNFNDKVDNLADSINLCEITAVGYSKDHYIISVVEEEAKEAIEFYPENKVEYFLQGLDDYPDSVYYSIFSE